MDTETSHLYQRALPATDPSQPHLVELGAVLYDGQWNVVGIIDRLIRPDGWAISPDAFAIHGISEQRCSRYGGDVRAILADFAEMVSCAVTIVGHNVAFDRAIIEAAIYRAGGSGLWWAKKANAMRCTMEAATPVCQLPGKYGDFRWPSLQEAHEILVPDVAFITSHNALDDAQACSRIYRALEARGAI